MCISIYRVYVIIMIIKLRIIIIMIIHIYIYIYICIYVCIYIIRERGRDTHAHIDTYTCVHGPREGAGAAIVMLYYSNL